MFLLKSRFLQIRDKKIFSIILFMIAYFHSIDKSEFECKEFQYRLRPFARHRQDKHSSFLQIPICVLEESYRFIEMFEDRSAKDQIRRFRKREILIQISFEGRYPFFVQKMGIEFHIKGNEFLGSKRVTDIIQKDCIISASNIHYGLAVKATIFLELMDSETIDDFIEKRKLMCSERFFPTHRQRAYAIKCRRTKVSSGSTW